jgi:hypothetical protein
MSKDGLDIVLLTQTWGFWGKGKEKRDLGAAAEIEEGKKYWLTEFSLPVLLGIDSTWEVPDTSPHPRARTKAGGKATKRVDPRFVQDLRIMGYPTLYLIDRNGVIRRRFMGWREKEVTAAVQRLLREGQTGTRP